MTNQNTIPCPKCGIVIYDGKSAPISGSYLKCKVCGYTISVRAGFDPPAPPSKPIKPFTPAPPSKPVPTENREEVELESLTPIEEIPLTRSPHTTTPSTTATPAIAGYENTTRETFKFTGTAGEYFRIWIVNIALTLVTVGIYSAWAKVRNNRYFYGNTRLMGSAFEYHADPIKILKGRAIVFGFFGLSNFLNNFIPIAGGAVSIALIFLIPWLVIKSMKFRARNSSYRNIRFNFNATYREALSTFVGYGFLSTITLGIGYPYFVFKRKEFAIGHSRYGTSPFKFSAKGWSYYKIYLKAVLLIILMGFAISAIVIALGISPMGMTPGQKMFVGILPMLSMMTFYLIIYTYLKTSVDNLSLSSASIGKSRLESTMRVREMAWIYISNAALIILTLGLMTPWAKIRTKRYKIEHLHLNVGEDFEGFIADVQKETSTLGEEAIDFLDFDIGL